MILDFILNVVYLVLKGLSSPLLLLPDVSLDSSIVSSISTFSEMLAGLNGFLPITTLLSIFAIALIVESALFIYRIVMWIIRKIPGVS